MMSQRTGIVRKLGRSGNSRVLVLTRDMREHLGIEDEVQIVYRENELVLQKPTVRDSVRAASTDSDREFARTYESLATEE
jgi:antitoxin component of MazEF toxin-antitoxin module